MDERKLLALGLLAGAASGKPPEQWLAAAHELFRTQQRQEPMNATLLAVMASAVAFYAAERHENPKVTSFMDALVYASTNISVGYSDILAKTSAGKAIGSALMTYGPALASRTFDDPEPRSRASAADTPPEAVQGEATQGQAEAAQAGAASEQLATLRSIAERLDQILIQLQRT